MTVPSKQRRALAPNQERYLLADTMTPQVYVTPNAFEITGSLDVARFEAALAATVRRHPAFSTGYERDAEGNWWAVRHSGVEHPLRRIEMPGATLGTVGDLLRDKLFAKPDWTPATLFGFWLIRAGPQQYWFVFNGHHSLTDGASFVAFSSELFARYDGETVFPELADYADLHPDAWRDEPAYRESLAWWQRNLESLADAGTLPFDLDADDPHRPADDLALLFDRAGFETVRAAAAANGLTPFNIYYAASLAAISRLQNAPQVVTAFQSAARRGIPGSEGVHGAFSNALMLGASVDPAMPGLALAHRVRASMREALAHEGVPYHEAIRATGVRATVGINWFPPQPAFEARGIKVSPTHPLSRSSDYDLNLRFLTSPEGCRLVVYYRAGLMSRALVEQFAARIERMALAIAQDPEAAIGTLDRQPSALPRRAADIALDPEPIHAAFERAAALTPAAVALRSGGQAVTYGALHEQSTAIAHAVAALRLPPGAPVAIIAQRGPEVVAAMLGVLRGGGAMMLVDSSYPRERWQAMAEVARPRAVLAAGDADTRAAAREFAAAAALPFLDGVAARVPLPDVDPAATAYLLFTSGTTGRPRCVATAHGPLTHFVRWQAESFALSATDRFAMCSGLAHDPFLRDVFTPLSVGATITIPAQADLLMPTALADWFARERPTVAHLTPPLGRLLTENVAQRLSLRLVFWGGDLLRPALAEAMARAAPEIVNVNLYGTTETPQAASVHQWQPGHARHRTVPVGDGIAGIDLDLRTFDGASAAPGEKGEILVLSNWPALGRVEDGVLQPFAEPGTYATGDLGIRLADGTIMHAGRADDQVKIRGHRVELLDAVTAVESDQRIAASAVLALGPPDDRALVAFVSLAPGVRATPTELRARLAATCPAYLVPSRIILLERLPLLPNGKLDRRALEARAAQPDEVAADAPAATPRERAILAAWEGVLHRPLASPEASFAILGGDSLSMVQAYLALEELLGEVPAGWQYLTVSELAATAPAAPSQAATRLRLRLVDVPVAVRALAIVSVVGFHFGAFAYGGGATSVLFIITGFLLGQFQVAHAIHVGSARPMLGFIGRIALASAAMITVLVAAKYADGDSPDLVQHYLFGDFYQYRGSPKGGPYSVHVWYVQCALHIMLILWAGLAVAFASGRRLTAFGFATAMFAIGCVTRFLLPALFVDGWFANGLPLGSAWGKMPFTHLPTLALGLMIATAPRTRAWTVFAIAVAYAGVVSLTTTSTAYLFIPVIALAVLFRPTLRAPAAIASLLLLLSNNSLFIYLLHPLLGAVASRLGLEQPHVRVVAAVALAVIAGEAWRRGSAWLSRDRSVRAASAAV